MNDKKIEPYLAIGRKASEVFSISAEDLNRTEDEILADVDVWIEFSSPEGLRDLIEKTQNQKTPIVSGTTGLTEKDFAILKKQATTRPIFWASNMSPGLWAFRQAMKSLKTISGFDFAIEEIHHTQKKDRPSGTAKTLHNDLENIVNKKIDTPVSYRLGGVFGIHTVFAASPHEIITMQHQALSRTVFAEGSVVAAQWLSKQKAGFYSMEHLFSTKGV